MKQKMKLSWMPVLLFAVLSSACYEVVHTPGPPGRDGLAFFAINYEHVHPYSYWDNNPAVPYNAILGYDYQTYPGIYEFEYFINPHDYWYGTYEIWVNPGGPGLPDGEPGFDGMDNFFTLICDPEGFHTHLNGHNYGYGKKGDKEQVVVIENKEGQSLKIILRKGNIKDRKAQSPKLSK